MSDSNDQSFGKKVMRLFVVDDNDKSDDANGSANEKAAPAVEKKVPSAVDDLLARYGDRPSPTREKKEQAPARVAGPAPVAHALSTPPAGEALLARTAIFKNAGLSTTAQEHVSKSQELILSLPADAPALMKKQIVEASLKAFGYPVDEIVKSALAEIAALDGYVQAQAVSTQKTIDEGNKLVAELNDKIAQARALVAQGVERQNRLEQEGEQAKATIRQVVEFFGPSPGVAPSNG